MNLYDYINASDGDKIKWLDSIKIVSGLPYFGGKRYIGKYLLNNIFNMAARMHADGHGADVFVDAFGGGGKIALSVPEGWFKEIVLNDINYGVYSYFECCRDNPGALVRMISELGKVMSKEAFKFFVDNRDNEDKDEKGEACIKPLVSAAMTYWVTNASYRGIASKKRAAYELELDGREKEEIKGIAERAEEVVGMVHDKIKRLHIRVERLDYRELIKKYNGKDYREYGCDGVKKEEVFKDFNKLWYFDPPYHPAALSGGIPAPYEDTFEAGQTREMAGLLHGDSEKEYGAIEYFIKSDYSPRDIYERKNKAGEDTAYLEQYIHDYDMLEENEEWEGHPANKLNPVFYKTFLGEFNKGQDDNMGSKLKGREYIWCRGNYIPEK